MESCFDLYVEINYYRMKYISCGLCLRDSRKICQLLMNLLAFVALFLCRKEINQYPTTCQNTLYTHFIFNRYNFVFVS